MIANKALISIFTKYSDFVNIFFLKLDLVLPEYTGINDYAIRLVFEQQLLYESIYSPGLIELETLKTYIKINVANGFIKPSKFLAKVFIFFDQKSDRSF